MDNNTNPKEMVMDELEANAAEYNQWLDWCNELEQSVEKHLDPNPWSWA